MSRALLFVSLAKLLSYAIANTCKAATIDFIVREGDAEMAAVEDDIAKDLAEIGVTVNVRFLNATAYADAETHGTYDVLFTRSWGAPYDPHSYMTSWAVPAHVEYSAIGNLQAPLTRENLLDRIEAVQKLSDLREIQIGWRSILEDIHKEALFLPLWGTRIPYVINRRLYGFTPGNQAYSIPVQSIMVGEGSADVTVAPGVGSLFKSTGPINPHQYSPNQLWAQDWIYEGLVSYGQDGEIVPALASSWTQEQTATGVKVTFKLRQGVKFHDGEDWNCAAAKLNFDHVLSDIVKQRHQWFGVGKHLKTWTCTDTGDFVLETDVPFYPLLQELTYIRPLRFASPGAFAQGVDSHPDDHNSCEPGHFGSKWTFLEEEMTCMGLSAPVGTGAFKFVSREPADDGTDAKVVFARNDDYWGQTPGMETLTAVQYATTEDVEAALRSGELDMALGLGPLKAKQVQNMKFYDSAEFDVRHSDVVQHALLVFNSNRAPLDDITVRRAIIHAVNKASFLEEDFAGLEQPVTQLLPFTAPFCNVDLSPKWGYDLEKAQLLNCPTVGNNTAGQETKADTTALVVIVVVSVVCLVAMIGFVFFMIRREKLGKPVFMGLAQVVPDDVEAEQELQEKA